MNSQLSHGESSSNLLSKNGTRLILSVDDEPAILFTRQQILEDAGYEVLNASDGEQALRMFVGEPVDLVLLDYILPGRDGGVIAQEMKRYKSTVPIMLVSASPIPEEIILRVDCRIDKGQGPALLLEKVAQFLNPLPSGNVPSSCGTSLPGLRSAVDQKWPQK